MNPIFPGRFQPIHNGHLLVIQGMTKLYGPAFVVMCEPLKPTDDALFTVEERREMIGAALLEKELMETSIEVLKDDADDQIWVKHLLDVCGNPDEPIVFSGRPEVIAACAAAGIPTKEIKHVPGIDGDEIRAWIKEGNAAWKTKVPEATHEIIARWKA